MGYEQADARINGYRAMRRGVLRGKERGGWFTDMFQSIAEMLSVFGSDAENGEIEAKYATGSSGDRIPGHLKLDYVCGMRREVRRQYVSEEDGICTDITPFRRGITSHVGASLFDSAFNLVINRKGRTS